MQVFNELIDKLLIFFNGFDPSPMFVLLVALLLVGLALILAIILAKKL